MNIEILFENKDIVVINKPAGLMVHADGRREQETLVDWFLEQYPDSVSVGEDPIETKEGKQILRPGIVHRLDRDTSGAMVLCKTDKAHAHVKGRFQE